MKNLSSSTYFGLFILTCILAAMVSIAVMQVVRTVEDMAHDLHCWGSCRPRWNPDPFDDGDYA